MIVVVLRFWKQLRCSSGSSGGRNITSAVVHVAVAVVVVVVRSTVVCEALSGRMSFDDMYPSFQGIFPEMLLVIFRR